ITEMGRAVAATMSTLLRRTDLHQRREDESALSRLQLALRARTGLLPRRDVHQLCNGERLPPGWASVLPPVVSRSRSRLARACQRSRFCAVRADGDALLARRMDLLRSLGMA